jgi:aryl-alcohol dehydrogenase-like predicted oxidoreductase
MKYRRLGRTGLDVSEIGFGGAPAGLPNYLGRWDPAAEEAARSVEDAIAHAVERGINYFDTAPGYGKGLSEEMFGRALEPHRERVILASKVKVGTANEVVASVEASLRRLRVDQLDVIQFHGTWYTDAEVDAMLAPGGALEGLKRVRDRGLARFIGFTTEGANGPASRLLATGEFDVLQLCYNLIFQHPYDPSRQAGLMYEAEAQGAGVVVMRPLTSGTFQRWITGVFPEVEQHVDLPKALLSFVLSNPLVDCAIVGMRSRARVDANCAIAEDESARIDVDALHDRYVAGE